MVCQFDFKVLEYRWTSLSTAVCRHGLIRRIIDQITTSIAPILERVVKSEPMSCFVSKGPAKAEIRGKGAAGQAAEINDDPIAVEISDVDDDLWENTASLLADCNWRHAPESNRTDVNIRVTKKIEL